MILSNVGGSATDAEVRRLFEQAHIAIGSVVLPLDKDNGKAKGSAYVELSLQAEEPEIAADFVMHRLGGADLGGRPITIEPRLDAGIKGGMKGGMGLGGKCGPPGSFAAAQAAAAGKMGPKGGPLRPPPVPVGAAVPGKGPTPFFGKGGCPGAVGENKFVTNRKTQICIYWREGRCTRGVHCSFAHGEEELANEFRNRRLVAEEMRTKRVEAPVGTASAGMPPASMGKGHGQPAGERRSRSKSRLLRKPKVINFAKKGTLACIDRLETKVLEASEAEAERTRRRNRRKAKAVPTVDVETEDRSRSASRESKASLDDERPYVAVPPAQFLLSEDGMQHLVETYGLGAQMLKAMGWSAGTGLGKDLEGSLEPVSVRTLGSLGSRFGRKDKRCLGLPTPKKFRDSDGSSSGSESRSVSSASSKKRRSSRSCSKSSRSSRSLRSNKKVKKRRRSKSSASRKSSKYSSSSSSGSSSTRSRKKRKRRSRSRKFKSPPAGGTGGAGAEKSKPGEPGAEVGAAVLASKPVHEPPEIALAKKQVLAKLTVMKNIVEKESRQKEFRQLLREWHPDKNPERIEMATAVFQFLQKGKSLLNLK